jgi:TIR domain/Trypsin-like peptidase domain
MQELLDVSLVRIHTPDGHVVGAGFFVGERHILTCAHVVARALGLDDDAPEKPQAPITFDVPRVAPNQLLSARVVLWRPPRTTGGDDIAGLELLDDPPAGTQPAPLAQVKDLWDHPFGAFGFPDGDDNGRWATGRLLGSQLITNWVQIEDVKETGFAVGPGFSGTPVWDTQVEAVVGMVVAAEKRTNLKTAFAIPVDVLARSWPLLDSLIHPFVFLCYARADSDLVTRLKTDLLDQGIHVWIDHEDLQPGTLDWEEALRTAIRSAQSVLLIASPHARSSRYVRDELRIAEMYQRPMYPLWIAGTQWMDTVPIGWGGAQYIDARESRYETAVSELVGVLNNVSTSPPKLPELDFEPRNPYKGLRAFTDDDSQDFFGRDELINALAVALEEALVSEEKKQPCARLLAVVGPSGSGKSSVVMAGLLPHLRAGRLPNSAQWVYLNPIVPGSDPIEHLALTL